MDDVYWVLAATAVVFVGYFLYLLGVERKVRDLEKRL